MEIQVWSVKPHAVMGEIKWWHRVKDRGGFKICVLKLRFWEKGLKLDQKLRLPHPSLE